MVCRNTDPPEPERVLQWCRGLVATIRDGGVWGIPRSGVVFRIDKSNKRLVLVTGTKDDEDFIATRRVFRQIGWEVLTKEEAEHE